MRPEPLPALSAKSLLPALQIAIMGATCRQEGGGPIMDSTLVSKGKKTSADST
jgi:hypothetical protein